MERTFIAPGVHLSCDPAEKFNRCRISVHFAFPAKRETATAHALLPLVLERGYADCPDMTRLTNKAGQALRCRPHSGCPAHGLQPQPVC